ncbi:DUF4942 domain-containing protein [Yersinia intermedia]|uniref:DUF4942 domain-containing protein n=1 Tax=Yersinia intermedia TaxID=631 RepID=A0A208ZVS5_YERIN|nr:DUF4942 domain-containing protein [Yersinia intermedia]OVZ84554.1 hypothetical protein CBW57_15635 [Yersinia intermedia]
MSTEVLSDTAITRSIGGGIAKDWAMRQDFRTSCWFVEKAETGMKAITRNLDRGIWRDQLADLERMLYLLDGKAIPDNRGGVTSRLYEHIRANSQMAKDYQDDYLHIKYFMKGSAHLAFRKPALIDKMNDIVAKRYSQMLSAKI